MCELPQTPRVRQSGPHPVILGLSGGVGEEASSFELEAGGSAESGASVHVQAAIKFVGHPLLVFSDLKVSCHDIRKRRDRICGTVITEGEHRLQCGED